MLNSSLSALLVLSTLASSSSFSSSFSFLCTSSSSFFFYKTLKSLYTHAHSSWESQKRATGWIWPSSHRWLTRSQQFSNTDQKLSKNPWCVDKKCQKTENNSDLPTPTVQIFPPCLLRCCWAQSWELRLHRNRTAQNHCAAFTNRQHTAEILSLPNMGNSGVGFITKQRADNTHTCLYCGKG